MSIMMSLIEIARLLGGEVSGGQARVPGPGHSAADRSLSIMLDDGAPNGFIVHSHAGDDAMVCKDYSRVFKTCRPVSLDVIYMLRKSRDSGPDKGAVVTERQAPSRADIDFKRINGAALDRLPALLHRWLPSGRREGQEWIAINPKRNDRTLGSFKINMKTGRWADFATGDKGGDAVSLAAYLFGLRQSEAARRLADALGISGGARHV